MPRNQQLSTYRGGDNDPFLSLHREMNRMFDDVFRGFGLPAAPREGAGSASMLHPDVDVSESEKEFKIRVDLPGVAERDVDVTLNDDVITIRAERKQERQEDKESYHLVERSHGMFQRALRLPPNIDAEHVEASFENGVLVVRIPKTEEGARSRRIQVQAGKADTEGKQQRLASATDRETGQSRSGRGDGEQAMPGNGARDDKRRDQERTA